MKSAYTILQNDHRQGSRLLGTYVGDYFTSPFSPAFRFSPPGDGHHLHPAFSATVLPQFRPSSP